MVSQESMLSMKTELFQWTEMTYKLFSNLVSGFIPKKEEREQRNIQVIELLLFLCWKHNH